MGMKSRHLRISQQSSGSVLINVIYHYKYLHITHVYYNPKLDMWYKRRKWNSLRKCCKARQMLAWWHFL